MPSDRQVADRRDLPHEYSTEPGPYTLPADEVDTETAHAAPRQRRSLKAPGRGLRTFSAMGAVVIFVAGLGVSMAESSDPRQLLARDTFERSVSGGWGNTDSGEKWLYPTGPTGLAVSSKGGAIRLQGPRAGKNVMVGGRIARDVTVDFTFSLDRMPDGNGARVMAIVRKSAAGSYRGRVRIEPTGRVWLSFSKDRWGQFSQIGTAQPVPGWTYKAGERVRVRMQAIKKDPAQLRLKAWPAGGSEPAGWQLVRNDLRDDVGAMGRLGLRTNLTKGASAPLLVRLHNFKANRAQDADKVAVTPARTSNPKSRKPRTSDETAPRLETIEVTEIRQARAMISWTLDEAATGVVRFGKTKDYGRRSSEDEGLSKSHEANLTELEPDTTYHYSVASVDKAGNKLTTRDRKFTTKAAPEAAPVPTPEPTPEPTVTPKPEPDPTPEPKPTPTPKPEPTPEPAPEATPKPAPDGDPAILAVRVTDITQGSATIEWAVDEPASGKVKYGLSPDYGDSAKAIQDMNTDLAVTLLNLDPNNEYHYKVVSTDADGNTVRTQDATFSTLADTPAPAPTPKATPAPTPKATPAPTPKATPAPTPKATPIPDTGSCDLTFSGSITGSKAASIDPGDVVCITAGDVGRLVIEDVHGTASKYVTIINRGGQVLSSGGISIEGSSYLRFTGTGDPDVRYGFLARTSATGLRTTHGTTDIEIDHVEVDGSKGTSIGFGIHTSAGQGVNVKTFVQRNTRIHDTYIHGVSGEGMYIGKNNTLTQDEPILEGLWVYDNKLSYVGKDSINVKGTPRDCFVYDNAVDHDSQSRNEGQQGAISIGVNVSCEVYGNDIRDGLGTGIRDNGSGGNSIHDNVIVNPGQGWESNPKGYGINIQCSDPSKGTVRIFDNTIVNPLLEPYDLGCRGVLE